LRVVVVRIELTVAVIFDLDSTLAEVRHHSALQIEPSMVCPYEDPHLL
jgi:hypothetical protein